MIALYGEPGTHKSFLALDWANHLARGQDWAGHTVDAPKRVLYVAGEGATGLQKRLRAWRQHHGADPSENLIVSPDMPRIDQSDTWADWLQDVAALGNVDLIVFDTLARLTVGLDENSNSEMMLALSRLGQLQERLGTSVLLVHHSGKGGGGMRGATSVLGACDAVFKMTRGEAGSSELSMDKQKEAEAWRSSLSLGTEVYTVGKDSHNRELTSLALVPGNVKDVPTKQEQAANHEAAKEREARELEAEQRGVDALEAAEIASRIRAILEASGKPVMGVRDVAAHLAMELYGENDADTTSMLVSRLRKLTRLRSGHADMLALVKERTDDRNKNVGWFGRPQKTA
jgi:hypothetical protein